MLSMLLFWIFVPCSYFVDASVSGENIASFFTGGDNTFFDTFAYKTIGCNG
jgi:hypothetical protein